MGRTIYQNCVKMLETIKGEVITFNELESLIIRFIGGQAGTINQALKVMATTGLIKDVGNARFEVL